MKVRIKESITERPNNFNNEGKMDYMLEFPRPILEVVDKGEYEYVVKCLKDETQFWFLNKEDCEIVEDNEPQVLPIQPQENIERPLFMSELLNNEEYLKELAKALKPYIDSIPNSECKGCKK